LNYSVAGRGSLLEPYGVDLPPRKITQAKYTLFYQAINEKIALPNRPHFSAKIADFGLKYCILKESAKNTKKAMGTSGFGALILMVHSPFPERLNQSRQGMVDAGNTKPK
jgi:hypothetical protein